MAKKVISVKKGETIARYAKVIRMVKSEKTGAYRFEEEIIPTEKVQEYLESKKEE
jgi:hypothetical protein